MGSQHLAFLTSQAAHIERQVYKIKYANIQYRGLVPVDTSASPWAGQITHFSMDAVGRMGVISNFGTDFPTVETEHKKFDVRIENYGTSYAYNEAEINQAMLLGIPLASDRAAVARRVYEELLDDIVWDGVTEMKWDGLKDHAAVTKNDAPNDGNANSREWDEKTGTQVARDINNTITGVWTSSKQVEMADTILLPPNLYAYISNTPMSTTYPMGTILEWIMKHNVYKAQTGQNLTIRSVRGLETAAAGNKARMIAYRKSPDVLKLHLPMALRFYPPQQQLLSYVVPALCRIGGLEIRLPGAIRYLDLIGDATTGVV